VGGVIEQPDVPDSLDDRRQAEQIVVKAKSAPPDFDVPPVLGRQRLTVLLDVGRTPTRSSM
jgi:hypothetical protein